LVFLPSGEKTTKKLLYGACHLDLFRFLRTKWQKKAKPTVNSRGTLFLGGSADDNYYLFCFTLM
jgi:hypothetical protein